MQSLETRGRCRYLILYWIHHYTVLKLTVQRCIDWVFASRGKRANVKLRNMENGFWNIERGICHCSLSLHDFYIIDEFCLPCCQQQTGGGLSQAFARTPLFLVCASGWRQKTRRQRTVRKQSYHVMSQYVTSCIQPDSTIELPVFVSTCFTSVTTSVINSNRANSAVQSKHMPWFHANVYWFCTKYMYIRCLWTKIVFINNIV